MHVDYDMYTEERMSNAEGRYSRKQMFQSFLAVFGAFFGILGLFEYNDWVVEHPIVSLSVFSRTLAVETNFYFLRTVECQAVPRIRKGALYVRSIRLIFSLVKLFNLHCKELAEDKYT